jgi:hypothetical protein
MYGCGHGSHAQKQTTSNSGGAVHDECAVFLFKYQKVLVLGSKSSNQGSRTATMVERLRSKLSAYFEGATLT